MAVELNATRGTPTGTVVGMHSADYDVSKEPVFLFSFLMLDPNMPITPHVHRNNYNAWFAFSMYHPGASLPGQPWSM